MRVNFWLILLLALAPLFIFFAGLWAVSGLGSSAGSDITWILAAAAFVVAYLARRDAEDDGAELADKATATEDVRTSERSDDVSASGYSSPARQPHAATPASLGYANREEVLTLLNQLLEAERAGARGAREMSALADRAETRQALHDVAKDEAGFCAMLFGHITRLGATPSRRTGAFHEKLAALEELDDRLELLNRGQSWVVRKLSEAVPKIADDALRADLQAMLDAHKRNIERCTRLVESAETVA